jgi:hypothetical protein
MCQNCIFKAFVFHFLPATSDIEYCFRNLRAGFIFSRRSTMVTASARETSTAGSSQVVSGWREMVSEEFTSVHACMHFVPQI